MTAATQTRPGAFERLVVRSLPYVPRPVVRRVARRYVAGETIDDVLRTVSALRDEGALATVDLLGEEASSAEQSAAAVAEYGRVLERLAAAGLESTISVKPTMLGLRLDEGLCAGHVAELARRATEAGTAVQIDMEDHTATDATLRIYEQLRGRFPGLGVALQAMLRRTPADIARLLAGPTNVRLVKGIYREPAELALQDREQIRAAFSSCLEALLGGGAYTAIATHDAGLVAEAEARVQALGLWHDQYEFQMLLGVLPALRRRLIAQGHRVRVYVPYGGDWYAYSLRRLRENPEVARHVARALFTSR